MAAIRTTERLSRGRLRAYAAAVLTSRMSPLRDLDTDWAREPEWNSQPSFRTQEIGLTGPRAMVLRARPAGRGDPDIPDSTYTMT
jgi:hypothetical protein